MTRVASLVALGAAALIVGDGIGEGSLLALGLALIAYALLALALVRLPARRGVLRRSSLPVRAEEGSPLRLGLELERRGLPIPGGTLHDPLLLEPVRVGPGWRGMHREVRLEGRGHRTIPAPELELRDPLGVFSRSLRGADDAILLLPRVAPIEALGPAGSRGGDAALAAAEAAGGGGAEARGIEFEVDGLRPYRPGAAASRIHWPTVARTGEMFERRLAVGRGAAALVVADSHQPADPEALDAAVRAAASLVHALAARGGCALRLSGERRTLMVGERLEGWADAHVRLAVLEPGPPPALPRTLAVHSVFWVSARPAAEAVPASIRHLGASVVAVTPFPAPGSEVSFTVAGCAGQPLLAAGRRRAIAGVA